MHTEFQFKLLHRRIPTNDFLAKIGIKDDPRCSFSKEETETVKMFMFSGFVLKQPFFWKRTTTRLKRYKIIPENYSIENTVALGLRPDSSKHQRQINLCFLLARHYIWLCKSKATSSPGPSPLFQIQNGGSSGEILVNTR